MTDSAASRHIHIPHWTQRYGMGAFLVIILVGAVYSISSLTTDLVEAPSGSNILVFLLLGVALLIALGFEFVNGFHDTANAVATVIYTHSLPAYIAVVWSGMFNSWASCCRAVRSPSPSSRCFRSSSSSRSAAMPVSPWCSRC
jgi:hypothetical protein